MHHGMSHNLDDAQTPDTPAMKLNVWNAPFTGRTIHGLLTNNVATLGELSGYTEAELLAMPWCGRKTLTEIRVTLKKLDIPALAINAALSHP